jgi:hypothetical protein
MKKKLALGLLLAFVAAFILAAPATTTVYVTKTGDKYHTATCKYLKKSKITMTLGDAIESGYEPCKVCDPPRLDKGE